MSITMMSTANGAASLHSLPSPHQNVRRSVSASTSTSTSSTSALSTIDHRQQQDNNNKLQQRRVTNVRQLFVGNLSFRVRWQDLKDLFRKAGVVIRADVALGHDNRSKGHGTVLLATVEDAQNAIDMLHNHKWHGRVLEVREDRGFVEPSQQPSAVHDSSSRATTHLTLEGNAEVFRGRQLFVGNLPFHCQWQDVKDLFRNAGNILRADVVQDSNGRSRGFGTVLYATHEDANKAIAMYDGYEFHGRQLRVHFDKFAPGLGLPHHYHGCKHQSIAGHSTAPYLPTRVQQEFYIPPPPAASLPFGQQQQLLRWFFDDDPNRGIMLQQSPPILPYPFGFHHREFPPHPSYSVPPSFPDQFLASEAQLAPGTLGMTGMQFVESPLSTLGPNPDSQLFRPWIPQNLPLSGAAHVEEEEPFFAPTSQDNALSDVMAAMSLSRTATPTAAADESAGLTSPLRSNTDSITGTTTEDIPSLPPSSLLTASSVWEPFGGFKY